MQGYLPFQGQPLQALKVAGLPAPKAFDLSHLRSSWGKGRANLNKLWPCITCNGVSACSNKIRLNPAYRFLGWFHSSFSANFTMTFIKFTSVRNTMNPTVTTI